MTRAYASRVRLLRGLEGFDGIYVHREAALIGPAVLERWVARRGKPVIYSLDDPLYIPYISPANGWLSHLKCFGKVATICRLSRAVIVNSRFHREYAERYNQNVWSIPSLVDERAYCYRPNRPRPSSPCIGWSGSPSTAPNLQMIAGVLAELARRRSYRLHLIGATGFQLSGIPYTAQPWRGETEVADLEQMDIGLVPLPDNEWNRRKFNLKVAQYMAVGIVPIASPIGANPEVIAHGVDGFLASTPEEWMHALESLLANESLRQSMSDRAAQKAHSSFTIQSQGPSVVAAFQSALA